MRETPPEIEQAARAAAARVKDMIVAMLLANETGEVAVVVSWGQLHPEKRVTTKARAVKVARGAMQALVPKGFPVE